MEVFFGWVRGRFTGAAARVRVKYELLPYRVRRQYPCDFPHLSLAKKGVGLISIFHKVGTYVVIYSIKVNDLKK